MSDQPTAGPFTPEQEARLRELIAEVSGQRPGQLLEVGRMSRHETDALIDDYIARTRSMHPHWFTAAGDLLPERARPANRIGLLKRLHRFFTALCPIPPLPATPADYSRPLKLRVFDQELRTRQIFAEEDFYSVNRRYPSWAQNAPGATDAGAQSDRRPERPAGFWPEQGAGS